MSFYLRLNVVSIIVECVLSILTAIYTITCVFSVLTAIYTEWVLRAFQLYDIWRIDKTFLNLRCINANFMCVMNLRCINAYVCIKCEFQEIFDWRGGRNSKWEWRVTPTPPTGVTDDFHLYFPNKSAKNGKIGHGVTRHPHFEFLPPLLVG